MLFMLKTRFQKKIKEVKLLIRIYIGESSSGKDTFCKKTHETSNGEIQLIVSSTTRPPRVNEIHGKAYWFETEQSFLEKVKTGEIIEYRKYNATWNNEKVVWYYGSPRVNPEEDWVAVLEIKGTLEYIKAYGSENLEIIYVYADADIREERAKLRGSFDKAEWDRRAEADREDFSNENLKLLAEAYGKPIITLNNNSDKPVFGYLNVDAL